jgi:Pyruvate/2-oxoacid:ferredoxin oxidoreductase delta subunit
MKNMFGCVIGLRKELIHKLFPGQPKVFSRVIADIYRTISPNLSFLDLTSAVEGAGFQTATRPVGLMLASTDGVALDTEAAHAIGYESLPLWIAHYGNKFGVGCNRLDRIRIRGIDWEAFKRQTLKHPWMYSGTSVSCYDRITALLNNTLLRPRPVISPAACTACGDCIVRCPVNCITPQAGDQPYRIALSRCADCGCCSKVCEAEAIELRLVGFSKMLHQVMNRMPERVGAPSAERCDPAAKH